MSTQKQTRPVFPFSAVIGQESMQLALLLNIVDPQIGGAMFMGDRGTGKSTTVRAFAELLPKISVVKGDPFNSSPYNTQLMSPEVRASLDENVPLEVINIKTPMVELPLGATEDRICGSIDMEKAMKLGTKAFEPGILARANQGLLYVDEVNLLEDNLVNVLLDCAASGWNTVEREGLSVSHPARFILLGSGNPEEGELRPQLLDRFGLFIQVDTVQDPKSRVQVVQQRTLFDENPESFLETYQNEENAHRHRIQLACERLKSVILHPGILYAISEGCSELNIDGLRGDLVLTRTAKALQALAPTSSPGAVTLADVSFLAPMCIRHRLRKDPLSDVNSGEAVEEIFNVTRLFEAIVGSGNSSYTSYSLDSETGPRDFTCVKPDLDFEKN